MANRERTPNTAFRRFRENERQESRAEFADALAALARERNEPITPSERYVARLEDGEIRYPTAPYRRVLVELSGRSMSELGFSNRLGEPSAVGADGDGPPAEGFVTIIPTGIRLPALSKGSLTRAREFVLSSEWPVWFGVRLGHILTMIDNWHDASDQFESLQTILHQEVLMFDAVAPPEQSGFDISHAFSRRQALATLAALPLSTAVPPGPKPDANVVNGFLTRCAASLTASWHLLRGADLETVSQAVSAYITSLERIAGQYSAYQETAARLASQAHRVLGIVALHRDQLKAREIHCKQALYYATVANDPGSRVSALISLASTYFYGSNPAQAATIYERALALEADIPPLQRSRVHAELAVVYGQLGREQDAIRAIGRSAELYPDDPEQDRSYLYAEFTPASLTLEHGLAYNALANGHRESGYASKAAEVFSQLETPAYSAPERIRFEIINHQAVTAVYLGDLESFIHFMTSALDGISILGSRQRQKEAASAWAIAGQRWPRESRLAALRQEAQHGYSRNSEGEGFND